VTEFVSAGFSAPDGRGRREARQSFFALADRFRPTVKYASLIQRGWRQAERASYWRASHAARHATWWEMQASRLCLARRGSCSR